MFQYQQMTNSGAAYGSGNWVTLSQHESSAEAQARMGKTTSTPERVIGPKDPHSGLPRLIVCRDPRPNYSEI